MFLYQYLRTTTTASLIALFIAACGGGGDSSGASAGSSLDPLANDPTASLPVSAEVLGDDIDADGVRDDIQMMIESEYAGNLKVMQAFKRKAAADRRALAIVHDQGEINRIADATVLATRCWLRSFSTDGKGYGHPETSEERKKAMNNYRRFMYDIPERTAAKFLLDQRINNANYEGFVMFANPSECEE